MAFKTADEMRAYQRQWLQLRRHEYLADKACAVCGRTDGLEVHHSSPEAKGTHRLWSLTAAKREAELAKCEVLCDKCHNRIHARVRRIVAEKLNPCGTPASYGRGCRCDDCRAAHSARNTRLRRAKQERDAA